MALTSGLSSVIEEDERVARFLRQSNYVVKSTGRIKHPAFLPAPDNDTSTFRIDSLNDDEVKSLAVEHVKERSKNGAAVFKAQSVVGAKLKIIAKEPPPRHANIRGWSMNGDPDMKKSERKTAAMKLAEESSWMSW